MQTAEYAVNNNVDSKPVFNWWVSQVLKKRNRIISKVKLCQKRFKSNGNTLWADVITKEMKNVRIAFGILTNGERVPNNHQRIHCYTIVYINMETFCCKARLVAGGNFTEAPKYMAYSSVVSKESV